jgi:phosphoserine phosphatase
MDHKHRQNEFSKGIQGHESWPDIIHRAVKTHPPYEHQINKTLSDIPLVAGMKEVFIHLKAQPDTTLKIMSGGNILLVKKYLELHECDHFFD